MALKRDRRPEEKEKTFPFLHRGHLPFQRALMKLSEAILAGSVPQICDYCNGEVRGEKQIEYPKIYSRGDTDVSIADIILKGCPAHRTLRHGLIRKCKPGEYQINKDLFHFTRSKG
jgi:hypothetical protein